jgi:hypothetical protein
MYAFVIVLCVVRLFPVSVGIAQDKASYEVSLEVAPFPAIMLEYFPAARRITETLHLSESYNGSSLFLFFGFEPVHNKGKQYCTSL